MVIAIITKSRPLMKRELLLSLFPTDDVGVDEDAGIDDDIEFEYELVGRAVFDTITRIKKQIKVISC